MSLSSALKTPVSFKRRSLSTVEYKVNTTIQAMATLRKLIYNDPRSINQIAAKSRVSYKTVSNLFDGVTKSPHHRTVVSILNRAYGIRVDGVKK